VLTAPTKKPGFVQGLTAVGGAFSFLGKQPDAWPAATVPILVFLAISGVGAVSGSLLLAPLAIQWLGLDAATAWYGTVGRGAIGTLSFVLSGAVGVLSAFLLTPTISAPALERLVKLQEDQWNAPPHREQGWIREWWCGLQSQAFSFAVSVPILIVLALLEFTMPWASFVLAPLQWLVICLALAWNLLDTPLTLRGVSASARIGLLLGHRGAVLGFGSAFALLFWIPCLGIVLLPVGAIAATRLVWAMAGGAPERLLPEPRD
jgi:CysZ protein